MLYLNFVFHTNKIGIFSETAHNCLQKVDVCLSKIIVS